MWLHRKRVVIACFGWWFVTFLAPSHYLNRCQLEKKKKKKFLSTGHSRTKLPKFIKQKWALFKEMHFKSLQNVARTSVSMILTMQDTWVLVLNEGRFQHPRYIFIFPLKNLAGKGLIHCVNSCIFHMFAQALVSGDLNKIANILLTAFSNAFSGMKFLHTSMS